jgi:hypothetical protein
MSSFDAAREEVVVPLPRLHLEGERGDLGRAGVDLHAGEVLREDERGDVRRAVAFLEIHVEEEVEGIDQDVAGAAGGVAQGDLLGGVYADEVLDLRPRARCSSPCGP